MLTRFKFFQKHKGWTFQGKIKYITYTNRRYKKSTAIIHFTHDTIPYHDAREFNGNFNRFLENYPDHTIMVESIYYLRSRKRWDDNDQMTINRFTHINLLPRIGINDFVRIRYKFL